jgi:hypothetical protein
MNNMVDSGNVLNAMKAAAWQRAKGELHSITAMSYFPGGSQEDWDTWSVRADRFRRQLDAFIETVEDAELYI